MGKEEFTKRLGFGVNERRAQLHGNKCLIEDMRVNVGRGMERRLLVSFSLTAGEVLTLENSLSQVKNHISQDLAAFLTNALTRCKIDL